MDEEGYGSRRLCDVCQKGDSAKAILTAREIENWRGKGKAADAEAVKSLYLGQNKSKLKDSLQWQKHCKLPVLKNGNHPSLHPVEIDKTMVSVGNTCALDSLLQIIFAAAVENTLLTEEVKFTILI